MSAIVVSDGAESEGTRRNGEAEEVMRESSMSGGDGEESGRENTEKNGIKRTEKTENRRDGMRVGEETVRFLAPNIKV